MCGIENVQFIVCYGDDNNSALGLMHITQKRYIVPFIVSCIFALVPLDWKEKMCMRSAFLFVVLYDVTNLLFKN